MFYQLRSLIRGKGFCQKIIRSKSRDLSKTPCTKVQGVFLSTQKIQIVFLQLNQEVCTIWIFQCIEELKLNPNTGKPLGYPFFREKKMGKYRLYFLVYEDIDTVLLITISDKNAQQETIDKIKSQLDFYKGLIRRSL